MGNVKKQTGYATKEWVMKEIRCLFEEIQEIGLNDIKVKVSDDDPQTNFLSDKLVASTGIDITVDGVSGEEKMLISVISESLGISKRTLSNGVTVIGTDGITTDLSSGNLTLTLEENAILVWGMVEVDPSDAVYTAGGISGGFKITIDHSTKGVSILRNPRVFVKTNPLSPVGSLNPLQYSKTLTGDQRVDQFNAGVVGHVFQQVDTRASGGCFIVF